MLGRRTPQMSLFDAASLPHRVAPESFYGRMGAVADSLFPDDDLQQLFDPHTGRPLCCSQSRRRRRRGTRPASAPTPRTADFLLQPP